MCVLLGTTLAEQEPVGQPLKPMESDHEVYTIRGSRRTLDEINRLYSQMPPLQDLPPPADRWELLPETQKKLQHGPTLRIVMLGDSLVNDTSRSAWERLLKAPYPRCEIEKIASVRGSTGCWWYHEPGRVQKYVLDHKPDLVIIGGISPRQDAETLRSVIRQIRAGSRAEVLVMTSGFGRVDPRDDSQWSADIDSNTDTPRSIAQRVAREEKAAFLDMSGAWGRYIRSTDKPLEWFKRDAIHANAYGEQVLGRILARYLTRDD